MIYFIKTLEKLRKAQNISLRFENIYRLYEIWETKESIGTLLAFGITFFSAVLELFYVFETVIRYLAVRFLVREGMSVAYINSLKNIQYKDKVDYDKMNQDDLDYTLAKSDISGRTSSEEGLL